MLDRHDKWGRSRKYVNGHNGRKYTDPKQYKREWNKRNPENYKFNKFKSVLRKKYNLELVEYELMKSLQQDKCKICQKIVKLVVDHSHTTDRVRGLLCSNCNAGLGFFKDNEDFLKNALVYLKDAEKKEYEE